MSSALHVMIMSTGLDGKQQFLSFGIKTIGYLIVIRPYKNEPLICAGSHYFYLFIFPWWLDLCDFSLEAWLKFVNLILQRTGIFL